MRRLTWIAAGMLLAIAPQVSPAQPNAEQDVQIGDAEAFGAAVTALRERMLRPGATVEGWNRGGANPDADLRRAGAETHYFLNRGEDGTSVGILSDRPIAAFAPAGWRVVDSFGSAATPLDGAQLDFVPLSARYVIATRGQFRRRGDVDCTPGIANALLYEIPGAASGADDEGIPFMFRMLILAMDGQELCVRADGDAARGYRSQAFLPDGRLLPGLTDDEGITTIVPAAPIDRLIVPPTRPATPSATS